MEVSIIYDLLAPDKLYPYRTELKGADDNFTRWERKDREALEKSLNEEQTKLLKNYLHSLMLLDEYINGQVELRALNYGIKIGMQLQHSIKDLDRYFDECDNYE